MHRVRMLIHFGVTPYLVFDGDNLPSKAGTEKGRRERRKEGKRLGLELLEVGKTAQAQQELQKSVDVTPEMARMVIEELKRNNVQYVVAPYEADSQLAYLERKGIIDGVLSEDSDLLVFSDTQSSGGSESQSTVFSRGSTAQSQDTIGTLTPASSPEPDSVFSTVMSSQMSELRTKFTYKCPSPSLGVPRANKSRPNRRPAEAWQPTPSPREITPTFAVVLDAESILPGTPSKKDGGVGLADSTWTATEADVVIAASSPPPMTPAKRRRSSLKGSEDLLVPDSEAESECSPRKPMFNLKRFAFAG